MYGGLAESYIIKQHSKNCPDTRHVAKLNSCKILIQNKLQTKDSFTATKIQLLKYITLSQHCESHNSQIIAKVRCRPTCVKTPVYSSKREYCEDIPHIQHCE